MSAQITPITTGTLKVSAIRFNCAPGYPNRLVVALGAMVEASPPGLRGLGLIARSSLTDFELDQIGELGRRMIANPFDYLNAEFEEAWNGAPPGGAIDFLRERHSHSLSFDEPVASTLPKRLFQDGAAVKASVRAFIVAKLDAEALLLTPISDHPPVEVAHDRSTERTQVEETLDSEAA
jgi:hypothetical protein